jgi:hypothetical protein
MEASVVDDQGRRGLLLASSDKVTAITLKVKK